jgi:hypothetical protein
VKDIPRERFDRDIVWPAPTREPDRERAHPGEMPDEEDGPFQHWLEHHRDQRERDPIAWPTDEDYTDGGEILRRIHPEGDDE